MLKIGTRVNHTGHGLGTIVAYNGSKANTYLMDNLMEQGPPLVAAGLGQAIISSCYDGARFPYVVQFDSGYKDVYGIDDILAEVL
jgi:hypothetical protein